MTARSLSNTPTAMALRSLAALGRPGLLAARRRAPAAARGLSDAPADEAAEIAQRDAIVEARSKSVTAPHIAIVPDGLGGSLPDRPDEVAKLMRIPAVHQARTVVISQKCQAATTSSSHASKAWRLGWKTEERWTNPLMGWTSTGDPLSNAEMKFETAEQAEAFATKMGWNFETERPIARDKRYGTNTYSHNFLFKHVEAELKANGLETEWFHKVAPNDSHYFRPLKFHGDGECVQHGHDLAADHDWKREGSPGKAWAKDPSTDPATTWNPFAAKKK